MAQIFEIRQFAGAQNCAVTGVLFPMVYRLQGKDGVSRFTLSKDDVKGVVSPNVTPVLRLPDSEGCRLVVRHHTNFQEAIGYFHAVQDQLFGSGIDDGENPRTLFKTNVGWFSLARVWISPGDPGMIIYVTQTTTPKFHTPVDVQTIVMSDGEVITRNDADLLEK